ncbi:uncharacterized protein LOC131672388 [Phymastichus coffea]|uniref:uncharacterized protein LOC131672388 n=1 Tax=Phymastichus coffea TaxID=108790 RepID=UPI00273C4293|nr:uncharacterized protein LOC131672388 [Phymastichus coffea]
MSLDDSYIEPYLEDWLAYIRKSSDAEQQVIKNGKEFRVPYAGATVEAIKAIFIISERFRVEHEAKYLAVHLLDRYMGCLYWERVSGLPEVNAEGARQVAQHMSSQLRLVLATCLQIASKVDLFRTGLSVSQVQDLLQSIDPLRDYSRESIVASELRVLRGLDFRIPVSLPLNVVELFLAYSQLPPSQQLRDTCLQLLDLAYIRHEDLFQQLHLLARGSSYDRSRPECRDFLRLETNAGFVGASIVVCSAFFYQLKKSLVENLAAKLAKLLGMEAFDLSIMANLLFMTALDEDDFLGLQQLHDGTSASELD